MARTPIRFLLRERSLLARLVPVAAMLALGVGLQPRAARASSTAARAAVDTWRPDPALIYDKDYPFMRYSARPTHNPVARLQAELAAGKVKLEYRPPRGYLDSLLKALEISPASQTLVFSKTSLQTQIISAQTPRAIYFNDDTYVAWIYGTQIVEINTMDSMLGTVFYTLSEQPDKPAVIKRAMYRCLACHDTFSMAGGGVPNFLFLSAYRIVGNRVVTDTVGQKTLDSTPMVNRWGGWYVTGKFGGMLDLGNILPRSSGRPIRLSSVSRASVPNLDRFFDTQPYLTDKSDVVALLVLENQVDIHNLIIHANYKSRMLLERRTPGSSTEGLSWEQLSPLMQQRFAVLLEPLVRGLLFVGAAKLPAPVEGNSGYASWFQAQGPFDPRGRSLRDLDLRTRLFKYPLSFLIYSKGFDSLIPSVKQYLYARLYQILSAEDRSAAFASLSRRDRKAALEILESTRPDFARVAREAERAGHTILTAGAGRSAQRTKTMSRRSGPKATSKINAGATMAQTRHNAKA
jgi:hypothetical protein